MAKRRTPKDDFVPVHYTPDALPPRQHASGRPQRAAQRPLNRSANERPIYDEFGNLLCTIKIEKLPARRVSRSRSSRLDEPSGSAPQAAGGPSPRHVRSLSFSDENDGSEADDDDDDGDGKSTEEAMPVGASSIVAQVDVKKEGAATPGSPSVPVRAAQLLRAPTSSLGIGATLPKLVEEPPSTHDAVLAPMASAADVAPPNSSRTAGTSASRLRVSSPPARTPTSDNEETSDKGARLAGAKRTREDPSSASFGSTDLSRDSEYSDDESSSVGAHGVADDSAGEGAKASALRPTTCKGKGHLTCNVKGCGKACAGSRRLLEHQRTHTGERPFVCNVDGCGKAFAKNDSLKTHQRTHTGERPFVCDVEGCGKAFASSGNLSNHRFAHTGERPFVCNVDGCGKAFSFRGSLAVHERTHTGARPFVCDMDDCGEAFKQRSVLVQHQRTHTGERPFVCDVDGCGKAFTSTQSGNLFKHKRTHKD